MKEGETALMTGVTGTVGAWIAREALCRGRRVVATMRDHDPAAARHRLAAVMRIAGFPCLPDSAETIRADVTEPFCGIKPDDEGLKPVKAIVHCAACTDFDPLSAEQCERVNVEGTQNVLELAESLRVPVLYISTAYVAGTREDLVCEHEIDCGQSFHNPYESTKCRAEAAVQQWHDKTGLPVAVIRPSIVIGDSGTGRIVNFNGMYNLWRFFDLISPTVGKDRLRVPGRAEVTKNFVPVDYLARAAWHILERQAYDTFHITNPHPHTLGQLRDIYAELFSLPGALLVDEDEFAWIEPSRAESMYLKASALYEPYLQAEPPFDRRRSDAILADAELTLPVMDIGYFKRLLDYARQAKWGKVSNPVSAETPEITPGIREYFSEFLSQKLQQRLLPDLRRLNATFRIELKGQPDAHWSLEISQGVLTSVCENGLPCQCNFVVDQKTFFEVTGGRLSPQEAFFRKRVDLGGDIETGLKLVTVLAEFFVKYPYRVEATYAR